MSPQELLEHALKEIKSLKKDEIFMVKDLFVGYLWNREDKADRLTVGTLFLNHVKSHPENIKILDKTSSNQQKYQIIKT